MAEPIYKINFTVNRAVPSVTPTAAQPAGYYGDDQFALVTFTLKGMVDGHQYRIEIVDGNGAYDITELLDAVGGVVSYTIPASWTAAGTATLQLIEIETGDDGTETAIVHYPPARLLFEARDDSLPMEKMLPAWQEVMHRVETVTNTLNHAMETGEFNGEKGEKGDKGDKGDMPEVDLAYDSTSANPQSGIALGPVISDISGAITHITGEIADARVDNFGNTHSSFGDSVRFMCHDLDSRKSNTDHEHRAEHIAIPAGIPHEQANENVYGALWSLNTEKSNKQEVANALKGTASGSVLALNDVSPVEHTMGVKVRGKNLFNGALSPVIYQNANFEGGVNESGVYKSFKLFLPKGTYTLSFGVKVNLVRIFFDGLNNGSKLNITSYTFTLHNDGYAGFTFRRNDETVWVEGTEIQLEKGTEASAYTPYIGDLTAVPEKQWQQVFSRYCYEFQGSNPRVLYTTKTFDIVVGREYTLETSNGMQGPNGLKYTCTAVENSYGGCSIKCSDIWVETCSEEYAQHNDLAWTGNFKISWVTATQQNTIDFTLTIKEHAGDMTKAVKLIKTNADGTVSEEYTPTADGTVNGVTSLYPCTKLSTNVDDIVIECEYNRDINKAFEELQQAIISLGGTV